MKKLYIKTYGCQMNVYDSQRMEESLKPLGFEPVLSPQEADLIIINTCHIRAKAEDKLFSDLGRLREIKVQRQVDGQSTIIVVAGCVGQALGKAILGRAPYVDIVVGPQTYHTLPETVMRILRNVGHQVALGFPKMAKFDELPQKRSLKGFHAFLTIQEGCNKFCRYCVVPFTRGPEYSRPVKEVLEEAHRLVDTGAKEITLLGQNVNAYHGVYDNGISSSLGKLIYHLAEIPGLMRLRYTTSHPRDVDDDLITAHRDVSILMPFLHLPVQSGSDKILSHMNRRHTQSFYLEIIDKFRQANASMAFSSDFIVGYPGESEEDFQATCDLIEKVQFAQAFSFKYSPRPGTPAALASQVPEDVKDDRLYRLQERLNAHRKAFNQRFLHQNVPVLIEGQRQDQWMGRTPFMQAVYFKDQSLGLGDHTTVTIQKAMLNSLQGVPQKAPVL